MSLTIGTAIDKEGIYIFSLRGSLDADTAASFDQKITPVAGKKEAAVILDLRELDYIDSTALASLMKQGKAVESSGGRFFLAGLKPRIRDVFRVVRIIPEDRIFEEVSEAVSRAGRS